MTQPKRFNASEQEALLQLAAAITNLQRASPLDRRVSTIPHGKQLLGGAKGMAQRVFEGLLETMPTEQLWSLRRNLDSLCVRVGVKAAHDSPNDYGRYLSFQALEALTGATRDHCMMCQLSTQQQRQCPLAKALDELPCSERDDDSEGCGYFGRLV